MRFLEDILGIYKNIENIEIFPWAESVSHRQNLLAKNLSDLKIEEYVKEVCSDSLSKVPKLKGESKEDEKMREMFYLNI